MRLPNSLFPIFIIFVLTSCTSAIMPPTQSRTIFTQTSTITVLPSPTDTPSTRQITPNQLAYGQWDEHYRYLDLLWLANSDGSQRHIPFEWLTFTDGYNFLPNRSDILIWVSEDLAGVSGRYILANLDTTMPDSCVTCSIKDEMYMDTPVPSPRGDVIAITANTGLYISDSDGTNLQKIIQEDDNVLYISGPPS